MRNYDWNVSSYLLFQGNVGLKQRSNFSFLVFKNSPLLWVSTQPKWTERSGLVFGRKIGEWAEVLPKPVQYHRIFSLQHPQVKLPNMFNCNLATTFNSIFSLAKKVEFHFILAKVVIKANIYNVYAHTYWWPWTRRDKKHTRTDACTKHRYIFTYTDTHAHMNAYAYPRMHTCSRVHIHAQSHEH